MGDRQRGGTTAAGVIDPLLEIAQVCDEEGLWLHADAAWGGQPCFIQASRLHLAGIERADSITCDAHKWLSVPMGCGMFFCQHRESVAEAFRSDVTYMPATIQVFPRHRGNHIDPLTNSAQWSRRFIGAQALHGALARARRKQGTLKMLDHQARMGGILRESLSASGWRIVNSTPFPVVCFTRDGLVPGELLAALRERQIAWMSEAQLGGIPVVRACITSYRTTTQDIAWVVSEMNSMVSDLPGRKTA